MTKKYAGEMKIFLLGFAVAGLLLGVRAASATEVKVSAKSLERTLKAQLFNGPNGRYYLRGDAKSACFVYAEDPHVSFVAERVVVHVKTKSKIGTSVRGACLGVSLSTETDVSFIPEAEEESVGFRDARLEKMSDSKELNFLLTPFLSRKLPQQMKLNAAVLIRQLLSRSAETTGYALTLNSLKLHSMLVEGQSLVVDLDTNISVD
jgi:hypothetical protein